MHEEIVVNILRTALRLDEIDPDTSIFSVGADSMAAIEIVRRLEEKLHVRLEPIEILKHPTVHALAARIARGSATRAEERPVVPVEARPSYPPSPIQRGLYLLDRMTAREDVALTPVVMHFDAALDPELARHAFRHVIARHEILRTTFRWEAQGPAQVVHTMDELPLPFEHRDLTRADEDVSSLQALYDRAAKDIFDLDLGPLLRFRVAKVGDHRTIGILTIHHAVSDAFSASTLERDFRFFYDAEAGERLLDEAGTILPSLSFQYKDYACWLERWMESPEGNRAFERRTAALEGAGLVFSSAKGPTKPSFRVEREDLILEGETLARVQRLGSELEVTPFVLIQSFLRALIHCETGRTDVVIGSATTTLGGRSFEGQIGPYVNTVLVRAELAPESSFRELASTVNVVSMEALADKLVPLETLMQRLRDGGALFDVGFTLEKHRSLHAEREALLHPNARPDSIGAKILFVAIERDAEVQIQLRYRAALFTHGDILAMKRELARIIDVVCETPDVRLADLLVAAKPDVPFSFVSFEPDLAI